MFFSGKDEKSEEEKKSEETELFSKYYTEWKGGSNSGNSYKTIPRFYYRVSNQFNTYEICKSQTKTLVLELFSFQCLHTPSRSKRYSLV